MNDDPDAVRDGWQAVFTASRTTPWCDEYCRPFDNNHTERCRRAWYADFRRSIGLG